jgi:hypothetical protein
MSSSESAAEDAATFVTLDSIVLPGVLLSVTEVSA